MADGKNQRYPIASFPSDRTSGFGQTVSRLTVSAVNRRFLASERTR